MLTPMAVLFLVTRSLAYIFLIWLGYRTPNKNIKIGLMTIGCGALALGLFNTAVIHYGWPAHFRGLAANFFGLSLIYAAIKIRGSVRR